MITQQKEALTARSSVLTNMTVPEESPQTQLRDQARGQLQEDVNQIYERLAEVCLEIVNSFYY